MLPRVIDVDYLGQICAMVWTPSPPVPIPKQSHITQLMCFVAQVPSAESVERATGGSGLQVCQVHPEVFWTQRVTDSRPNMLCSLEFIQGSPLQATIMA